MQLIIFIISVLIIGGFLFAAFRKKAKLSQPDADTEKEILRQHVLFYQRLPAEEKIRFEERLNIEMDIDEDTLNQPVPPMMLMSLVENAIKHGLEPKAE